MTSNTTRKLQLLSALVPCALLALGPPRAGATQTVATFGGPAGPASDFANYSTGFELFENGLYWWQGYSVGGESGLWRL